MSSQDAGEWDSAAWRRARDAKLLEWLGDPDAVQAILAVSTAAEVWDDAYDRDKEPDMDAAMTALFLVLPMNRFWAAHQNWFTPIITVAINAWMDARVMEKSDDQTQRAEAFVLRNFGIELALLAIFILRGFAVMRALSMDVREFFRHQSFRQWEQEHGH